MSKWDKSSLKNITELMIDGDWIESKDQSKEGIRLIQTGNIGEGEYIDKESHAKYISDETFARLKCSEVFEGDILVSRLPSPVGRACIIPQTTSRMITAVDCTIMRFNNLKCLPKYFLYFSMSRIYSLQIDRHIVGSTRARISRTNLETVIIPLPPLEIQKKIALTLDTAAELLAMRKQQLVELDNLIKSTFYDMFGDPVINEKGWQQCFINDVFEIIDGDRGINYPKQEDFFDEGFCLFLNTGNVTSGGFSFNNVKFISEEKDKQLRKGKAERGDVILTTRGTVGNIVYYSYTVPYDVIRINSGMVLLRSKNADISPVFFCELFKNNEMLREINSYLSGTAQPQLPITNLKKIKIILPQIELQTQFATIVIKTEEHKALVKKAVEETQHLFDSLMSEYFD